MSVQLLLEADEDRPKTPANEFMLVSSIGDINLRREASIKTDSTRQAMSKMSSVSDPPSYDEVVNQQEIEKTQRQIWGVFVVYLSHFCGIHPIRAPYFCNATECKRLNLWDRLSWFDIFVCVVNLLVSVNHIYLRFFSENSNSLWNSHDKAQWVQTFVTSITPPLIIIASMVSSPGLDRLIQLISNEKVDISQSQNKKRIQKWFNIMFWLNFLFGIIVVAQLAQIIFMDFISYNFNKRRAILDSDFITLQTPLAFCIKRFMVEVDRIYFNIMFFAVVKIPQVIIMMISIEMCVMFSENTHCLGRKKLNKDRLVEFFQQFRRLETIHSQLESTYNTTILIIIMCKLTIGTVKSYVLIRYLARESDGLGVFRFIFYHDDKKMEKHPDDFYMCFLELGFTLLGIALDFVWTAGFVLSLVYCNDMSRSSTSILLNKLVDDEAKPTKDQILQKLNNGDWGISMGKFKRVDRSAVITMISLVFTVVAVWLQLGSNQFK